MKPEIDLWALENELYDSGISTLCGVDEAGRGPLAGPVCAAAVILPHGLVIPGLDDSKKLSEKRREALYDEITQKALHWHAAFASVGIGFQTDRSCHLPKAPNIFSVHRHENIERPDNLLLNLHVHQSG